MPTYEYACRACGHRLEAVQKFTDDALTECLECGGALRKVFNAPGIVLKGSGFYKTDTRAADKRSHSDTGGSSSSGGSDSSNSESKAADSGSNSDSGSKSDSSTAGTSSGAGADKPVKESKAAAAAAST